MEDLLTSLWSTWNRIAATHITQAALFHIPAQQCLPEGTAGNWIHAEKMYFTIRLNEMYLAANQQWFVNFDPLVLVVTEFDYGSNRVAIPAVVGPELIPDPRKGGAPKYGSVIEDIPVAGPYPYRGGDVVLSVRFYKVPTTNLVRSIMKTIGGLAHLSSSLHELEVALGVASAILAGVEGLLGLETTSSLAAYRGSLAPSVAKPFRAQVAALVTPPIPSAADSLWSIDGRLCLGPEKARRYAASDFVLVSVEGSETRTDVSKLPFGRRRGAALRALTEGAEGLTRAKGILLTAYAEMLESLEMTAPNADKVFDSWLQEYEVRKALVERVAHLGPETGAKAPEGGSSAKIAKLNKAVHRLGA
jgi:hypothetical protein